MSLCTFKSDGPGRWLCEKCGKPYVGKQAPYRACGVAATVPEYNPSRKGGPGTELKRLLRTFRLFPEGACKCDQRALAMDSEGSDWCEENVETIVDWLQEEAAKRKLPFLRVAGRILVRLAIRNARKKAAILSR